jgi:DNA-directed RNA polymerase II subunit RPB1
MKTIVNWKIQIMEDTIHDRLKLKPGMIIQESFESIVKHKLDFTHDQSGKYAQMHLKEDNIFNLADGC